MLESDKELLESVLKRRFFFVPSFDIYGGVSGFYDYGPPGCALQANIIDLWRKHFILEENMLEVDCSILTPHEVLKTSGHVDKFSDWMTKDFKTGEMFRVDHLIEQTLNNRIVAEESSTSVAPKDKNLKQLNHSIPLDGDIIRKYKEVLNKLDGYSGDELAKLMEVFEIVNPTTGGKLQSPMEFNLMFETSIGPSSQMKGFLRPETAQGQFLNFNKLLEFNNGKIPFASASIGKSFRNEISPRAGLLRVREFLMAEIEYYVDPQDKSHKKFKDVQNCKLSLLSRDIQERASAVPVRMTLGDAVNSKIIDNQTLAYFMARIYHFLISIGIDNSKLRFRQHMANEMAHYATDCWDAEILTSYGWIECVGCADRSAYDLTVHAKRTKEKLIVRQTLENPVNVSIWDIDFKSGNFYKKLRKQSALVKDHLTSLSQSSLKELSLKLELEGSIQLHVDDIENDIELTNDDIKIVNETKTIHVREYIPNVIEPSFGIGRIIYALIEHCFWRRQEDEARAVFSFPAKIAPSRVLVVPLSSNKELVPMTNLTTSLLKKCKISFKVDDSSVSIGRRYARNDELGTPFAITIDFESKKDETVTLRERDSKLQVRGSIESIVNAIDSIINDELSWKDATKNLTKFEIQNTEN
ncbi:hypothetical protein Kpol_538p16 [Vanderwaltozyma polyspora DSM 70294]|uniref:glycine--tRNA ligase n=1 Tax=Vanderwaltozyma polyspora (strain ATCC 22028 / DSM 70294 / BCRC 21397 / CBS 2163 / NBRC 10782 / NRRL Y-8283 / UCD 57-17) TaxID=436907 RepID=A7TKC9_VANPO|nr:uncharacterized protein Kpol_538p16 [Vanderwaltozyma polyspora DSM 70294]EDO17256.1 hypothetical protein Kpol_538p16 [Vanderwaltozyma polyspora DSM 70294]